MLLEHNAPAQLISDLCLVYSTRNDELLRHTITDLYWPAARRGQISFGTSDVISFIHWAEEQGRVPVRWSDAVTLKVSRGVLRAMADFGFLTSSSAPDSR